jgi:predicted ester cyclase
MSARENRALTMRVFEALSGGDLGAAEKVLTRKLKPGARESAKAAQSAFPDLRVTLDDIVAEGDKVVARWTATGTHKGPGKHSLLGTVKATGRALSVSGITILRFENGQVVETWGLTDELGGARQLGVVRKRR